MRNRNTGLLGSTGEQFIDRKRDRRETVFSGDVGLAPDVAPQRLQTSAGLGGVDQTVPQVLDDLLKLRRELLVKGRVLGQTLMYLRTNRVLHDRGPRLVRAEARRLLLEVVGEYGHGCISFRTSALIRSSINLLTFAPISVQFTSAFSRRNWARTQARVCVSVPTVQRSPRPAGPVESGPSSARIHDSRVEALEQVGLEVALGRGIRIEDVDAFPDVAKVSPPKYDSARTAAASITGAGSSSSSRMDS